MAVHNLGLEIKYEGDYWGTRYPISSVVCSGCGRTEFFADVSELKRVDA